MHSLESWHWWAIVGIILIILEMYTFTFFLASFGLAAFGSSIAAAAGATTTWQLATFAFVSVISLALIRPVFTRGVYKHSENRPTNVEALAGVTGTVVDEIPLADLPGRVRIFGEEWRAVSSDGSRVVAGSLVEVVAVNGATLTVQPKPAAS